MSAASIVTTDGNETGTVQLLAEPTPHVLVFVDIPVAASESRGYNRVRTCELQRPDGSWVAVGSWDDADISSGVWAIGVDPALLDATAMRVTARGDVVATATFG